MGCCGPDRISTIQRIIHQWVLGCRDLFLGTQHFPYIKDCITNEHVLYVLSKLDRVVTVVMRRGRRRGECAGRGWKMKGRGKKWEEGAINGRRRRVMAGEGE